MRRSQAVTSHILPNILPVCFTVLIFFLRGNQSAKTSLRISAVSDGSFSHPLLGCVHDPIPNLFLLTQPPHQRRSTRDSLLNNSLGYFPPPFPIPSPPLAYLPPSPWCPLPPTPCPTMPNHRPQHQLIGRTPVICVGLSKSIWTQDEHGLNSLKVSWKN